MRYWAFLRQSYSHAITSQALQKVRYSIIPTGMCVLAHVIIRMHTRTRQVFCYVEDVPLLLILDDFIQSLDHLLLQYENIEEDVGEREEEGKGKGKGEREREEERKGEGEGDRGKGEGKHEQGGGKERELKKGGRGGGGGDMDGQYVALLEMHCLLRQRLHDVQHNWRAIYSSVFSPLGKTAGIGHTPISLAILVASLPLPAPLLSPFLSVCPGALLPAAASALLPPLSLLWAHADSGQWRTSRPSAAGAGQASGAD